MPILKPLASRFAALGFVLAAAPAVAAEGEGAGLPQLDPAGFQPQLIWLAITFVALYFLMSRLALPRINEVLSARQQKIDGDLARAESLKSEAETVLAAYQKTMADARATAQAEIQRTQAELAKVAAEREHAFGATIAKQSAEAERRIDAARQAALADLRNVAVDLTQSVTQKLVGLELPRSAAEAAVKAAAGERR